MNSEPLEALLDRLRAGDHLAAEQLFQTYEPELRLVVRRRLSRRLRSKFDSIDVVQSVWARVLHDFQASGCRIVSTAHLRNFLIRVTRNSLIDRLRHFRRALGCEERLPDADAAGTLTSCQPRPSEVARANELWDNLLAHCPEEHHEVLRLKRQGLPVTAIATCTGLHEASIRRILRKLARRLAFPIEQS